MLYWKFTILYYIVFFGLDSKLKKHKNVDKSEG